MQGNAQCLRIKLPLHVDRFASTVNETAEDDESDGSGEIGIEDSDDASEGTLFA